MKKILVSLCLCTSFLFAQSEAKININDKSLEISADAYLNYFYALDNSSKYYFGVNYIRSENNINKNTALFALNFKVLSEMKSNNNIELGIGVKTVVIDNGINEDFVVVPFGLHAVYNLNKQFSIDTNIYYASKVLSFSDAKRYFSYELNANYEIVENAFVFIGGRSIETQYQKIEKIKFDQSVYAGFKFLF